MCIVSRSQECNGAFSIAVVRNGTFYLISRDHSQPIKRPEFDLSLQMIKDEIIILVFLDHCFNCCVTSETLSALPGGFELRISLVLTCIASLSGCLRIVGLRNRSYQFSEKDFTATFCSLLGNFHPFMYFMRQSPATTTVFLSCCWCCCSCCLAFACPTSFVSHNTPSLIVFFLDFVFFFSFSLILDLLQYFGLVLHWLRSLLLACFLVRVD